MPAYEQDGEVLVILHVTSKLDTRYSKLGFNPPAALDQGDTWSTHFAIPALMPSARERMAKLVRKAIGG